MRKKGKKFEKIIRRLLNMKCLKQKKNIILNKNKQKQKKNKRKTQKMDLSLQLLT